MRTPQRLLKKRIRELKKKAEADIAETKETVDRDERIAKKLLGALIER